MEEARQVFLDACQKVAAAFESDGFRWRRSKADLVRKDGDLTFIIRFQSSFRNVLLRSGEANRAPESAKIGSFFAKLKKAVREIYSFGNISFIVHVAVEDQRIAQWRKTLPQSVGVGALVASTNVGYLRPGGQWLEINLAPRRPRDKRIEAVIKLVREFGFPYFDRFRNPQQLVESIIEKPFQGMLDFGEVEYAVFYGSPRAGRRVIERCLRQCPFTENEYRAALQDYRQNGTPVAWESKAGPRLAKAALLLGIESAS